MLPVLPALLLLPVEHTSRHVLIQSQSRKSIRILCLCSPAVPPYCVPDFCCREPARISCHAKILHCAIWDCVLFRSPQTAALAGNPHALGFPFWRAAAVIAMKYCNHRACARLRAHIFEKRSIVIEKFESVIH